jgi:hypothetical protein
MRGLAEKSGFEIGKFSVASRTRLLKNTNGIKGIDTP